MVWFRVYFVLACPLPGVKLNMDHGCMRYAKRDTRRFLPHAGARGRRCFCSSSSDVFFIIPFSKNDDVELFRSTLRSMSRRPSRNFSHASKNGKVTGIRPTKLPGMTTTSRKNTIGKSCTFENKSSPLFSSFVVFIVDFFYFFFFTAKSSSRGRHHVRGRFSHRHRFP